MKTKQIYYIAAMAMLTACTSSEEFEASTPNGKQKVEFADPFVGKGLTRVESGDIDNTSLKKFDVKVWGQEVNKPSSGDLTAITGQPASSQTETPFYNGDVIKWDGSAWTCTNEYYYPRDKYTFRFAAFAPAQAIYNASSNTNGVQLNMQNTTTQTFTGTAATDADYGITNIPLVQEISNETDKKGWDLLVSNRVLSQPTTGSSDRTPISFTFQHILSRLSFYVYTTSNTPISVKVTNITAYLPKTTSGTACYNQNTNTANPTAETNTNTTGGTDNKYNSKNSTWNSNTHDTWKWTSSAFTDIIVSTPSDFKSQISDKLSESSVTYQSYVVFNNANGQDVTYKQDFANAIKSGNDALTNIGSEFFLAPTPAYKEGETDNVDKYHFYVTVNYTVTEGSDTKNYSAVLPLYESDFYRFKQGWHHKLYLNLSSKKIRFISATVSDWDKEHNEDMTVSREVEGWTSEQN